MSRSTKTDLILIGLPGVIWGASFLFIAEGLRATGPMGVTLLRIAIGFVALAFFRAAWKPIEKRDWPNVALVGLLWMAFPMSMFPFAEQRISSALAGMLNGTVPLASAAVAAAIARALPARNIAAGLAVGLVGAVMMGLPSISEPSSAAGVLMVVAAVISYGFALNLARPLQQKYGALPVIWRAQLVAMLLTLPLGAADVARGQWSLAPVLSLIALGAGGTGIAHVIATTAAGRLGATRASAAAFIIPPVALLLGVLVRHEAVASIAVLGGAVCILGAWLMRRASTPTLALKPAPLAKAAVVTLLAIASPALAQTPTHDSRPTTHVLALPRITDPITLDGRGDDVAWASVTPLPMTVYLPQFGRAPTERTDVRIAYDDDAIYLMIDAWEAHPGGVRASSMIRDDDAPGDFINVLLDTFGDRQNAVNFSTTPGGQRNDWSVSNDARDAASLSPAWNGVWDVVVRRADDGWHAEYRIPFTTLRFQPREGRVEFGLSINRLTSHSNERVTFPAIEPTGGLALWKPSRWQRVSVENIHAARALRFTPYAIAGLEGRRTPDPAVSAWARDDRIEGGADLKMALSPNLTLDLTANTDFAEAEADDQRVNLTRFPLFFPERRPFFVERAGTFDVRTGEADLLFNSRRVGLTAQGEAVRLLAGARLVGRLGGWDVGLFDAQTDRTPSGSRENLGVARVRRGVLNARSWIGFTATTRLLRDSGQAALGADGELYLGGDDYANFAVVALAGDAGLGPDDGFFPRGAARLLVERRRNLGLWYRGTIATTGARYAPALGYVERGNAIRPAAELGYGRIVSRAGHQLRGSVSSAYAWRNATESFESGTVTASVTRQSPTGALWTLSATHQEDDLLAAFTPTTATAIPAGRYAARFAQLSFTPSTGPRAVVGAGVRAGEYYDGTLYSVTLSPEWRASAHLRLAGELQLDRLDFPSRGQREWSRLARLRVLASASPRLSLSALLQASSVADLAMANVRLRYNVREGHDLWVVYGHHEYLAEDPRTARAGLMVKYARSFGT